MTCSGPDMLNTPSYASGTIIGVFVVVSLIIERSIHYLGIRFEQRKRKQLLKALEAMKEELMLLGFISLFLTVFQPSFASICVPWGQVRKSFLLCNLEELPSTETLLADAANATTSDTGHHRRLLSEAGSSCPPGQVPFIGVEAMHQIHIFIFTLAGVHIIYSCVVMTLAYVKVEWWAKWEEEAIKEAKAYFASNGKNTPALNRVSTFQKKHEAKAGFWLLDWAHCFLKSFYQAVGRADYKALRVAFITNHNLSHEFAFHKFLLRSLEADYSHVVGVTPFMWLFVVFFVIFDIPQGHIVYWLPDIFVMIILLVGAKLARVVQVLARDIDLGRMDVCVGVHLKPRDSLFWFKRPAIMLSLMHFTLFTNSFQLASVIFYAWSFGVNSCYFFNRPYSYLRIVISVVLILFTSWVTLPTYALVSQMGSHFRPTIFGDHVQHHLKGWAKRAKAQQAPPEETGPLPALQNALGSMLTLVKADGLFKKDETASASAAKLPTDEDEFAAEVKEVMGDDDVEKALRPAMVDDGEQTEDGEMDGTTGGSGHKEPGPKGPNGGPNGAHHGDLPR